MKRSLDVLVMGGDGIGPEVVDAARPVMDAVAREAGISLNIEQRISGGACYDLHGVFITEETKALSRKADIILFGAEGGPKWDYLNIGGPLEDKSALSWIRKRLDLYFNLRPVKALPALVDHTSLKAQVVKDIDLVVVRELCSGIYYGQPRGIEKLANGKRIGLDTQTYTEDEIERVARSAFALARTRRSMLTSMDKANVMDSCVLWREVVTKIGESQFPDVTLNHLYCDNGLYQLALNPGQFDVILCDNLFGDLVSDAAGAGAGSLGMLPSASLGPINKDGRRTAVYEPVHGSAPDISGRGIANPLGTILSIGMMSELSFERPDLGDKVEQAVQTALASGVRTFDLGGTASTSQMSEAVLKAWHSL